ncbi:MAG: uroporphyrinogen decarboxylase family protein [Verrucomicrobia bacterium]|nr:uroporphyrinogen decarboxylase family protein [Verrucomicrobiota bacterium]
MNSRQLVLDTLQGRRTERVPVAPMAVHACARYAGISLHRYTSAPTALADAVIRTWERFHPDAVFVSADTWVTAQAMGARVGALAEDQPWGGLGEPLVRSAFDLKRIRPPDPATQGRFPLMLAALRRVAAVLGRDAAVVACFDQFPFSLAAALMGINELMLALQDDPALVRAVMERGLDYGLAYGRALAAAGADVLTGGDSPAGLIGPRRYREFALPYEQRLIAGLKAVTGKPVSLHICGDARPIIADMARSGADGLEIDQRTDLGEAFRAVGPGVTLWGNLDPVGVLARGSPADVHAAAGRALAAARAAGPGRFILSSGCTLAVETPAANVEALISAVSLNM